MCCNIYYILYFNLYCNRDFVNYVIMSFTHKSVYKMFSCVVILCTVFIGLYIKPSPKPFFEKPQKPKNFKKN